MRSAFHATDLLRPLFLALCAAGALTAMPAHALTLRLESVKLPTSTRAFPGDSSGAKAANSYCLTCHSAGMVFNQPDLTEDAWLAEVKKMKDTFKAPVPPDELPVIATYLASIKGKK
jgi:cytochrome c5